MFFRRSRPAVPASPSELDEFEAALGAAVDQFGRELGRHYSRRKARQPRGSSIPARLSSLPGRRHWFRAQEHPLRLPQQYRRGTAPTVLTRDRDRRGRPGFALEVEARAEGFAAKVRRQLRRFGTFLKGLRDRFRGRPAPVLRRRRSGMKSSILPAGSGGRGDGVVSVLVLAATAGLAFDVMGAGAAVRVEPPPQAVRSIAVNEALETRIEEFANAIAIAEGYFAEGPHDGHTLPYLLNNPGALKKPTLGAADLPTWKDTGLVWFPNAEMGWRALRHQVRLMLTGTSGIYAHSDSLISVGDKYADGDLNWGINVATTLGVPPALTLADLSPPE